MLHLENISKSYTTGDFQQVALDHVSLSFRQNEFVAILGPSGSGKTTLLNLIGGLDQYDEGDLILNGRSTKDFRDRDWDAYRNNSVGFVFQNYNLIPHLTITDNVELGMALSGVSGPEKHRKAVEVLTKAGLQDHIHKRPNQLSGGQMQRVAIARALANDPDIILADEPTGALDTGTSVQILDLIREIARNKLVIMVTHNPNLAKTYADRIIEFRDGKVISDSNPYEEEQQSSNYRLNKTSMTFFTALKLSGKNIRTKKFRTALTSFASSIGIIGIALILALSNGFDKKIAEFESGTLSGFPILISRKTEEIDIDRMMGRKEAGKDLYPDAGVIYPYDSNEEKRIHTNSFTEEYLEYMEKMNPEWLNGIAYTRLVNMNILVSDGNKATTVNAASINFSVYPANPDSSRPGYLETDYDLLAGTYPADPKDLILVTDKYNRVDQSILEGIGLPADKKSIRFDDILGRELRIIPNDEFYKPSGGFFTVNGDPENLIDLYRSNQAIRLQITGIIHPSRKTDLPVLLPGIAYSDALSRQFIEDARESAIVQAQRKADYNVLTGEAFHASDHSAPSGSALGLGQAFGTPMGSSGSSAPSGKDSVLSALGADGIPYMITVYPVDFQYKDEVLKYLDAWNQGLPAESRVIYTDLAGTITDLSGDIMHAITIVLIAFAATSLVVSLIMIGIITYVSVLERTKEIGVLRALGARKKDITRVFNAETFLIGAVSGLLGILIAALLTGPVNRVLYRLTDLQDVAQLHPLHAAVLILISMALTMLGGLLPARMAANKDPVAALRSE